MQMPTIKVRALPRTQQQGDTPLAEIIVVTSGKGGVGKTTTSASIACGLARRGKKVAVIDFDVGLRNLDLIMGCERRVVYDFVNVTQGEAGTDSSAAGGFAHAALTGSDYENLGQGALPQISIKRQHDQPEGGFTGAVCPLKLAAVSVKGG